MFHKADLPTYPSAGPPQPVIRAYPPMTLTVEETADELNISRATAYRLVREKGFPSLSIGNRIVVDYQGLQRWVSKQSLAEAV